MRLSQDGRDSISRAIMNDYLGREYDCEIPDEEQRILTHISQLTPEQAFECIVTTYKLNKRTDEIAYLQAIHEQIVAFCASKVADIQLFLKMWDEKGASKNLSVEKNDSTIELTTIHKAKGLEKKVVLIPYCSWSLAPLTTGLKPNVVWAEAEEGDAAEIGRMPIRLRQQMGVSGFSSAYFHELVYSHIDNINLLYVALTRAAESLHVFVPKKGEKHVGALLISVLQEEGVSERYTFGTLQGPAPKDKLRQTIQFIKDNYGALTFDCKQYDRLYEFMTHDKKNSAGIINFTLMGEIGDIRINQSANKEEILEILDFYRETMGC